MLAPIARHHPLAGKAVADSRRRQPRSQPPLAPRLQEWRGSVGSGDVVLHGLDFHYVLRTRLLSQTSNDRQKIRCSTIRPDREFSCHDSPGSRHWRIWGRVDPGSGDDRPVHDLHRLRLRIGGGGDGCGFAPRGAAMWTELSCGTVLPVSGAHCDTLRQAGLFWTDAASQADRWRAEQDSLGLRRHQARSAPARRKTGRPCRRRRRAESGAPRRSAGSGG